MSKKTITCIALTLVGVLLIFNFTYKFIIINYNNQILNSDWQVSNLKNLTEPMKIERTSIDDYISFYNIRIGNFFNDFVVRDLQEINQYRQQTYHLPEPNNNVGMLLFTWPALVDNFINDDWGVYLFDNQFHPNYYNKSSREAVLRRYNITNDIEFMELLANNAERKLSVFSSFRTIREVIALNQMLNFLSDAVENITVIEGDFDGYIMNKTHAREVRLFINGNGYSITFINRDYFTDDLIREIISTIEFIN